MRSALDEELYLVHPRAQIAGLKRAQMAALKGLVWLPPGGCLETCLVLTLCHRCSGTKSPSIRFVKIIVQQCESKVIIWLAIFEVSSREFIESVRV